MFATATVPATLAAPFVITALSFVLGGPVGFQFAGFDQSLDAAPVQVNVPQNAARGARKPAKTRKTSKAGSNESKIGRTSPRLRGRSHFGAAKARPSPLSCVLRRGRRPSRKNSGAGSFGAFILLSPLKTYVANFSRDLRLEKVAAWVQSSTFRGCVSRRKMQKIAGISNAANSIKPQSSLLFSPACWRPQPTRQRWIENKCLPGHVSA